MAGYPVAISQEHFTERVLESTNWRDFVVDSRKIQPGGIFFALPGERTDGHCHVHEAVHSGARAVVVNETWFRSHREKVSAVSQNAVFVPVNDSLRCLQDVGAAILHRSQAIKIGITGSNGKTSTKNLLASILSGNAHVHHDKGNLNSSIGLPLVCAQTPENVDYVLLEMAMSERGEMKLLADLIYPHAVLFTNIGMAHIGNLGSIQAVAEEKFQAVSNMGSEDLAVMPVHDSAVMDYLKKHSLNCRQLFYGQDAEFGFHMLEASHGNTVFEYNNEKYHVPLKSEYQLSNVLGVITLAQTLGLNPRQINEGLAKFVLPPGRGNILRGQAVIIDDSYNANPDSMKAALATAGTLAENEGRKLVLILGDMKELGDFSLMAHTEILRVALGYNPQYLLLLGSHFAQAVGSCSRSQRRGLHIFPNLDDIEAWLSTESTSEAVFLVKASRSMHLERIIPFLSELGGIDA